MSDSADTLAIAECHPGEAIARLLEAEGPRAGGERAEVQRRRVDAAIADAGGVDAVAIGIKEALLIGGQYWPEDVEARAATVATLEAQLARLGGPAGGGKLALALATERDDAAADFNAARSETERRIMARISGLVASACVGDEAARAAIEGVARATPKAFAADLARTLMEARHEYDAGHVVYNPRIDEQSTRPAQAGPTELEGFIANLGAKIHQLAAKLMDVKEEIGQLDEMVADATRMVAPPDR